MSKGSKNNIENRGIQVIKTCSTCHSQINSVRIIRSGKSRMVKTCGCGYRIKNRADLSIVLG